MSHCKNKVDWCLKKAEKELESGYKHRGLIKTKEDKKQALAHIAKAEHDLMAAIDFAKIGYSDWSASAFFYSMYHCLLAIAAKLGYESRNQECTFALIYSLIEDGRINLNKILLDKRTLLDAQKDNEENSTSVEIREKYQYGTRISLDENLYKELLDLSRKILSETKEIIEK